jgi:hypothetical protein
MLLLLLLLLLLRMKILQGDRRRGPDLDTRAIRGQHLATLDHQNSPRRSAKAQVDVSVPL